MRKLWRFLRYGPRALKMLDLRGKALRAELDAAKKEIEALRKEMRDFDLRMRSGPPEAQLTDEQIMELRKRQIPGLTPALAAQIDWERM